MRVWDDKRYGTESVSDPGLDQKACWSRFRSLTLPYR